MALFLFTKSIINKKPIKIFNNGEMLRDFTYIDDVIESIYRLVKRPATIDPKFDKRNPNPASSWSPYRIFNIGNSNPINLMEYIEEIESCLNMAKRNIMPLNLGYSNQNYKPNTSIKVGIKKFIN